MRKTSSAERATTTLSTDLIMALLQPSKHQPRAYASAWMRSCIRSAEAVFFRRAVFPLVFN